MWNKRKNEANAYTISHCYHNICISPHWFFFQITFLSIPALFKVQTLKRKMLRIFPLNRNAFPWIFHSIICKCHGKNCYGLIWCTLFLVYHLHIKWKFTTQTYLPQEAATRKFSVSVGLSLSCIFRLKMFTFNSYSISSTTLDGGK